MTDPGFIHLRVHSAYSLSEGAIRIPDLVALCRREGMPAVAVTDTGNLFGAMEFAHAASEAGIQPLIGCQLAIAREDPVPAGGTMPTPDQLVVLVQNATGYGNLLALVSQAFLETESGLVPHLTLDDLAGRTDGLIALTGGPRGALGRLLEAEQAPAAEAMLQRLRSLFPDRLYVEVSRLGLPVEKKIEPALIDLAMRHGVPLVATNEAFFADEEMYQAHDALMCIASGRYVGDPERERLSPRHCFPDAAEMRSRFADLPEAVDNTVVIARRCAFMPEAREPILPPFDTAGDVDEPEALRIAAREGLDRRMAAAGTGADEAGPWRERLDYELGVITGMGFAGYFLIVADFIAWAREHGVPVGPGRGSGAGSVVAWALGITDLDPLRWGLLFERFLNPDRVSMPDFDIDFCQERRDEVIHYVQQKYGRDHVAQIITFGKLQARAVLRDVGRVLEMPYGQVDRICKMVPNNPAAPVRLAEAIAGEPRLREMRREDPTVSRLMDIALKLEGLYRHASTHAAGLVIGDRPLQELVPLYRDPRSSMPVTQFSMKYVEQAGLVKFDFLGLKTLTVLARAQALLAGRGIEVDLARLPLDDARTYEMLNRGETVGVFQLESSGMRSLVREAGVGTFEDIIALVALFRPGPMENIPRYTACKHGREKPEFLHETIEPITADTYGVIIYQEQVMQIAQAYAGFTLGQADLLRRAMGKKIKAEMAAQRDAFVTGAMARGDTEERANYVFDLVDKFAGYGFNKAHSAAYAMVAWQTAWMKANHPVEFLAASMTMDLGNTDKLNVFRQELRRLEIPLLPPDVNQSRAVFAVEQAEDGRLGIRYALGAVRNVGLQAMEALVVEREANGPFRDPGDFAERLDSHAVNRRSIENLAAAGAFDSLHDSRTRIHAAAEAIVRRSSAAASERASNQSNLFGEAEAAPPIVLPEVAEWNLQERLQQEFGAIGFYLSAHPLDDYGAVLERQHVVPSGQLVSRLGAGAATVKLAGTVLSCKERTSQRGNRFAFVTLSDADGVFEVTVFSELLGASRDMLESGAAVLVHGEARLEGDQPKILAQRIERLDQVEDSTWLELEIHTSDGRALETVRSIFERGGAGRGKVRLVLGTRNREVEMQLPGGYAVSTGVRAAIRAVPGITEVREA